MSVLRPVEIGARQLVTHTRWVGSRLAARIANPSAVQFCDALMADGYEFEDLVNVVPSLGVIYVSVPKVASTRIKRTLAETVGRYSSTPGRKRRLRGLRGPHSMTVGAFHRLAIDPRTLRFSFVRNPYARAVSCWADKWQAQPLVGGDPFINRYLALRSGIDPALPAGVDRTLSFAAFVSFASAVADARIDLHLQAQHDILAMPDSASTSSAGSSASWTISRTYSIISAPPAALVARSATRSTLRGTGRGRTITHRNCASASTAPMSATSTCSNIRVGSELRLVALKGSRSGTRERAWLRARLVTRIACGTPRNEAV